MKENISTLGLVFCEEVSIQEALRNMYKGNGLPKTIAHWMLNAGMHNEVVNLLSDKNEQKAIEYQEYKGYSSELSG